jgi:hypothetical protein
MLMADSTHHLTVTTGPLLAARFAPLASWLNSLRETVVIGTGGFLSWSVAMYVRHYTEAPATGSCGLRQWHRASSW